MMMAKGRSMIKVQNMFKEYALGRCSEWLVDLMKSSGKFMEKEEDGA